MTGYDDWKSREPVYEEACAGCGHEAGDCRCPTETKTICGWCGRPWDEIEDHDVACAFDQGEFIGPHQQKIVPQEATKKRHGE